MTLDELSRWGGVDLTGRTNDRRSLLATPQASTRIGTRVINVANASHVEGRSAIHVGAVEARGAAPIVAFVPSEACDPGLP